jgi:hypothetical protein
MERVHCYRDLTVDLGKADELDQDLRRGRHSSWPHPHVETLEPPHKLDEIGQLLFGAIPRSTVGREKRKALPEADMAGVRDNNQNQRCAVLVCIYVYAAVIAGLQAVCFASHVRRPVFADAEIPPNSPLNTTHSLTHSLTH